jgi:hypothetical protein
MNTRKIDLQCNNWLNFNALPICDIDLFLNYEIFI